MKMRNLLLNMSVITIAAVFCLTFAWAEQWDLSSPTPSKEKTQKEEKADMGLELTPAVPVSPAAEPEETGEVPSEQTLEEEGLEDEGQDLGAEPQPDEESEDEEATLPAPRQYPIE
jgi:hypothetical protein